MPATADVEYAQAAGNYVNLRVRGHDYPLRITMAVLEQRLDPGVFLRPHRSWLIPRGQLRSIEPLDGGEALLHMAMEPRCPAAGASCRCCGRRWGQGQALIPGTRGLRYHCQSSFECITADMIELNPVRQRITDLTDRVLSLRGYL